MRGLNKNIILFFDEPYLGSFGSAYIPINRQDVIKCLSEFSAAIESEGVLLGVHCCGNTDWSIFTDVPNIDIINFDAYSFLDKFVLYADNLKGFLNRGGVVCWGIVPTQVFSGTETPDLLIRKIKEGIDALSKKGIPEDLLLDNFMLSPACGLGAIEPVKAEKILKLLSETSACLK